jgi:hypothetical protein
VSEVFPSPPFGRDFLDGLIKWGYLFILSPRDRSQAKNGDRAGRAYLKMKNQTVGTHYHIYLSIGVTRFPKENDFPVNLKVEAIPFTRCIQVYML